MAKYTITIFVIQLMFYNKCISYLDYYTFIKEYTNATNSETYSKLYHTNNKIQYLCYFP